MPLKDFVELLSNISAMPGVHQVKADINVDANANLVAVSGNKLSFVMRQSGDSNLGPSITRIGPGWKVAQGDDDASS
jgi:hypothetical protein